MANKKPIKSKLQIDPVSGLAFYDMTRLLKCDAYYNIIFGGRSGGKTCESLEYGITQFVKSGYKDQFVYLRRWDEDIKGKSGGTIFDALIDRNRISELTNGEYTTVLYRQRSYYLARYDEELDKVVPMSYPFAHAFSLSRGVHYKSSSYPNVTSIIFDEFLTNGAYLVDEYVLFMNLISTIVRKDAKVKIFMIANTINKSSIYFTEMNIKKIIDKMEQGTIEQLKTQRGTTLAIEYCADGNTVSKVKTPSDVYFGFDNPNLKMITEGVWEIGTYPHCTIRYSPSDVRYYYFIIWDYDVLQCNIVKRDGCLFTHIIRSNTQYEDIFTVNEETAQMKIISPGGTKHRVYCKNVTELPHWYTRLPKTRDKIGAYIAKFFIDEKVFYEDNEVGSIVQNYLNWC